MKPITKFLSFAVLIALAFTMVKVSPASANLPVAVQVKSSDTLAVIAKAYGVTPADLMASNPQLKPPVKLQPGTWLYLPFQAQLPRQAVFAVSGPSETELQYVIAELENVTVFRIIGRQFYYATWMGVPVVVFATGGSLDNPSIGVIAAAEYFNMQRFCYEGIGGGGHGTDVGDVIVATGVVPGAGQGNIAPLVTPLGDVVIGQFWSYFGEPVISDAGYDSKLVLTPDLNFMGKVSQSAQKVQLPNVNPEVADFESYFYGKAISVYKPVVHLGWTSTGPFMTSDLAVTQIEQRSKLLAGMNGLPAPTTVGFDMEDFEAVHAAVEVGIQDWCVIRSVVDPAREKLFGSVSFGVPWNEQNDPAQPWKWIGENNTFGFFQDYNYFYHQTYLVMKQIVSDWGLN